MWQARSANRHKQRESRTPATSNPNREPNFRGLIAASQTLHRGRCSYLRAARGASTPRCPSCPGEQPLGGRLTRTARVTVPSHRTGGTCPASRAAAHAVARTSSSAARISATDGNTTFSAVTRRQAIRPSASTTKTERRRPIGPMTPYSLATGLVGVGQERHLQPASLGERLVRVHVLRRDPPDDGVEQVQVRDAVGVGAHLPRADQPLVARVEREDDRVPPLGRQGELRRRLVVPAGQREVGRGRADEQSHALVIGTFAADLCPEVRPGASGILLA